MTLWIIEPRDPLIVRDGRPFGPNPGARAATLAFPFPSTLAGGLRQKAGLDADGVFDTGQINHVLKLGIRGPLLVRLNEDADTIAEWLPPAPADALVLELDHERQKGNKAIQSSKRLLTKAARIKQLIPQTYQGATNMPDDLLSVGQHDAIANKVSGKTPHFWRQSAFKRWLENPHDISVQRVYQLGIGRLATDARTHVSVQPETLTAREGFLFQTQGLVFTEQDRSRLALACFLEHEGTAYTTANFTGGLAALGGERRVMRWMQGATLPGADPTAAMREQIIRERRARVVLLTPAAFTHGYRPPLTWTRGGATATLKAALVQRSQVVSGWDIATGKPKPTRRLAPAGSVYFIEWDAKQDVAAWLDATWMQNVSDPDEDGNDKYNRDGFGLAVYGVWSEKGAN